MYKLLNESKESKSSIILVEKNKFPKIIIYLAVFSFFFSFASSGPGTLFVIYMRNFVGLSAKTVITIIHVSGTIGGFTPILGAIISDNYLGPYKTIVI